MKCCRVFLSRVKKVKLWSTGDWNTDQISKKSTIDSVVQGLVMQFSAPCHCINTSLILAILVSVKETEILGNNFQP